MDDQENLKINTIGITSANASSKDDIWYYYKKSEPIMINIEIEKKEYHKSALPVFAELTKNKELRWKK